LDHRLLLKPGVQVEVVVEDLMILLEVVELDTMVDLVVVVLVVDMILVKHNLVLQVVTLIQIQALLLTHKQVDLDSHLDLITDQLT
tara:strand:- start:189 stop:446 length:258 start_codon:yes stop_codon:yes gene_type:complete